MSDKDSDLAVSKEIQEITLEYVRLTLDEGQTHLDAIAVASERALARLEALLPLPESDDVEGVNWVALNIKATFEALDRFRQRLNDEDVYLDILGLLENVLFFSQGMLLHTAHTESQRARGQAASELASRAAKAKFKPDKEKVIKRYYELMQHDHFRNGSRASVARKIASEPGITVTEGTIDGWIKAELQK